MVSLRRACTTGFTLIELLLVVVLIAIAASLVSANLGVLETRSTAEEVQRLTRVLQFASERAAVSGYPIKAEFLSDSYRFSSLDASGKWRLLFDPVELSEHAWRSGFAVSSLSLDGQLQPAGRLAITFAAEATPFELQLSTGADEPTQTISGNSAGEVVLLDPLAPNRSNARNSAGSQQ